MKCLYDDDTPVVIFFAVADLPFESLSMFMN